MMEIRGHPQRPVVNIVNVIAWLPGRDTGRVVVMGGHYDSCICSRADLGAMARFEATQDAPGADDDATGTSAVVELARVFSKHFRHGLETSVIFVAYSGEEQGLYGSTHLAQRLHTAGYQVVSAFTDDIVGNVVADDGTVDSTTVRHDLQPVFSDSSSLQIGPHLSGRRPQSVRQPRGPGSPLYREAGEL